jgi:hypothetical protein
MALLYNTIDGRSCEPVLVDLSTKSFKDLNFKKIKFIDSASSSTIKDELVLDTTKMQRKKVAKGIYLATEEEVREVLNSYDELPKMPELNEAISESIGIKLKTTALVRDAIWSELHA